MTKAPLTPLATEDVAGPLGTRVTDQIRAAILDGNLRPGQRLLERDLAAQLGVSRSPVREAMHRLQEEGLVASLPGGGAHVAHLTIAEVEEIYEVRASLERLVGRLAVPHISPSVVAELQELIDEMKAAASAGDVAAQCSADIRFHQRLAELSRNGRLLTLLTGLHSQIVQVIRLSITGTPGDQRIRDHEVLVDVLRRGDPEAAATALEQHVTEAGLKAVDALNAELAPERARHSSTRSRRKQPTRRRAGAR